MIELVEEKLSEFVTPELTALVVRGYHLLNVIGATSYEFELKNILYTANIEEPSSYIQSIIGILNVGLNTVFADYQIVMDFEDSDLDLKVEIVDALRRLEDSGDVYEILSALSDEGESPEEQFAQILASLLVLDVEDLLPKMVEVNPNLNVLIRDRYETFLEEMQREAEDPETLEKANEIRHRARERTKKYLAACKRSDFLLMEPIQSGFMSGQTAALNVAEIQYELSEMTRREALRAAQEIMFAVLYSSTTDACVMETVNRYIEETFEDLSLQTEVAGYAVDEYQKVLRND